MRQPDLGRDARDFLAAARGAHDAPPGAKDRVRFGLTAALTAPAVTGVAAALGAGARARWLTTGKLAVALAIVGAGAAAILVGPALMRSGSSEGPRRSAPASERAPAVVSRAEAVAPPAPLAPSLAPPAPVESTPASPLVVTPELLPRAAPVAPARKGREVAPQGSVAAEVAILRRASAALRAGDAKGALAAVNEHARRFPHGALAEERDTERIVALCAGGDKEAREAAARATETFVRAYPSSPHEARVRAACAPSGVAP